MMRYLGDDRPRNTVVRHLAAWVTAVMAAVILSACSQRSQAGGELAESACDAASAAQTAALTLRLAHAQKTLDTTRDTALGDALTKLLDDESAVAEVEADGSQLSTKSACWLRSASQ